LRGGRRRFDDDGSIGGEPILDVILDLLEVEGDPVQIKLCALSLGSGLIVLFDNLLSVGLVFILAKVIFALPHELDVLDPEHFLQEEAEIGGWNFPLFGSEVEYLRNPCFIPLEVLVDYLHRNNIMQ
jgi:hypothetical protein